MSYPKLLPDSFTLALIGTLTMASLLPCRGTAAVIVDHLTNVAIALLFFLHGAKLSREAVIAAASHWRLHVLVLLTTFVLFPLFGLAFRPLLSPLVTPTPSSGPVGPRRATSFSTSAARSSTPYLPSSPT